MLSITTGSRTHSTRLRGADSEKKKDQNNYALKYISESMVNETLIHCSCISSSSIHSLSCLLLFSVDAFMEKSTQSC